MSHTRTVPRRRIIRFTLGRMGMRVDSLLISSEPKKRIRSIQHGHESFRLQPVSLPETLQRILLAPTPAS